MMIIINISTINNRSMSVSILAQASTIDLVVETSNPEHQLGMTDMASAVPLAHGEAPVADRLAPETLSADVLRATLREALQGKDLATISLGEIRAQTAQKLGLAADGLDCRKKEIKNLLKTIACDIQREQGGPQGIKSLAEQIVEEQSENAGALQQVYLVTVSRILTASLPDGRQYRDLGTMSRQEVGDAVRLALDDPVAPATGRPRALDGQQDRPSLVTFLVVFQELHEDGCVHFLVAVKLARSYRFANAKRTLLERDRLPSHWSCTHTQAWSVLRYCYIETPTKPEVDESPWIWTADGSPLDLFERSQQPFAADLWRKRREAQDKEASRKKAKASFNKLDLTALVMSKHLYTKDQLLAYVQDHGTAAMQLYVTKHQRRLDQDIDDVKEWAAAKSNAELWQQSDWSLLCQCAEKPCPAGPGQCSYEAAVEEIFQQNRGSLNWTELAAALRAIIREGPKKVSFS